MPGPVPRRMDEKQFETLVDAIMDAIRESILLSRDEREGVLYRELLRCARDGDPRAADLARQLQDRLDDEDLPGVCFVEYGDREATISITGPAAPAGPWHGKLHVRFEPAPELERETRVKPLA